MATNLKNFIKTILLLSCFLTCTFQAKSQIYSFSTQGCPGDSVKMVLLPQYAYAKFIINDGVESYWGREYTATYGVVNKVVVRAFFSDNSENIKTYNLQGNNIYCDIIEPLENRYCVESEVKLILSPEFEFADFKFEGLPGYLSTDIVHIEDTFTFAMPPNFVNVTGSVRTIDGLTTYKSFQIKHTFLELVDAKYCKGEEVVISNCFESNDTEWVVEGIGVIDVVYGNEVSFTMPNNDVNIKMTDPKGYFLNFNVLVDKNGPRDIIDLVEIDETCRYMTLTTNEEYETYNWQVFSYLSSEDTYSSEREIVIDLHQYGYNFYLNIYLEVTSEGGCEFTDWYEVPYNIYTKVVDLVTYSSIDLNCEDCFCMGDTIDITLDNNLTNPSWKVYDSSTYRLVEEGNSSDFSFVITSPFIAIVVYANDISGNCYKQSFYLNNYSIENKVLINSIDQFSICPGEEITFTSLSGNPSTIWKLISDGGNTINTFFGTEFTVELASFNTFNYGVLVYDGCYGQYQSLNSWALFDLSTDIYCVGELITINTCSALDIVTWEYFGINNPITTDSTITFVMPNNIVELNAVWYYDNTGYYEQEIKLFPQQATQTSVILPLESNSVCQIFSLSAKSGYEGYEWYYNNSLVGQGQNVELDLTDIDDLPNVFDIELVASEINGCQVRDVITLEQGGDVTFDNFLDFQPLESYCENDQVTLICPDAFLTCRWFTLNDTITQQNITIPVQETLQVDGIDSEGCIVRQILTFNVLNAEPITPCLVTPNETAEHNVIYWSAQSMASFTTVYLYKENNFQNLFSLVDSFGLQTTNYIDLESNPSERSYKYKLTVRNICGEESDLSTTPFHKTLHLTASLGVNGEVNLVWDQYEGLNYDQVLIHRGVNGNTTQPIAQLAPSNFTFTDLLPPPGILSYRIELIGDFNCSTTQNLQLFSNPIALQVASGLSQVPTLTLEIYPNPAETYLTIDQDYGQLDYVIYNLEGKTIQTGTCTTSIDVRSFRDGVYYVHFEKEGQQSIHRFFKG